MNYHSSFVLLVYFFFTFFIESRSSVITVRKERRKEMATHLQIGDFGADTMKAWAMEKPGSIADIKLVKAKIPTPGVGEIRVKMVAATTNPVDYKRAHMEGFAAFPAAGGVDGAGTVHAVGEGVTELKIGDRVHFFNDVTRSFGTFADYSIVRAAGVVKIPDGVTFETAAVIPCAAWTAYEALYDRLRVEPAKTLVVNAAAGGVGHFAVQLGLNAGCRVVAIASGESCSMLRDQGVGKVIDYKAQNVVEEIGAFTGGVGADYILDCVSKETAKDLIGALRFGGAIAHIVDTIQPPEAGLFMTGISTHHVFIPGHFFYGDVQLRWFAAIGAKVAMLARDGVIRPHISKTVAFADIREQLLDQEKGRTKGKVLIKF